MFDLAGNLKALGDENRLKIIGMLKEKEVCACEILEELNISQPTLSHHMKILCNSNLVKPRRDGKWVHYSLDKEQTESFLENLQNHF
jgi:ArsR family transcriptional regulator, arsenate/arsenite/antimonite-responsive transcriptional repressor